MAVIFAVLWRCETCERKEDKLRVF